MHNEAGNEFVVEIEVGLAEDDGEHCLGRGGGERGATIDSVGQQLESMRVAATRRLASAVGTACDFDFRRFHPGRC